MRYRYVCIRIPLKKNWQYQVPTRRRSYWNTHMLLVGIQNGAANLGNSLVVSYKVKHTFTTQSQKRSLRYLSKTKEDIRPTKPTWECLWQLCSLLPINWKQCKCVSTDEWMDMPIKVHHLMEYSTVIKYLQKHGWVLNTLC